MKYVDMHIHSSCSDGTMNVKEIIDTAILNQVGILSITDHDTIEAIEEGILYARDKNIKFISGIELDAVENGINYHILGYGIDIGDTLFMNRIKENRQKLELVNQLLIMKMEKEYDSISLKEYQQYEYDPSLGGWKALHYFVHKGLSKTVWEGFKFYHKYNHSYTCVDFPNIQEICQWIHEAKGKAVLAHPGKVIPHQDITYFETKLSELMKNGIDGIECYYPSHTKEIEYICINYCQEHSLIITSGADCHGSFEKTTIGQLKVLESQLNLKGIV